MYQLVQFIRHRAPFAWGIIESVNSAGFSLRYRKAIKGLPALLSEFGDQSVSYRLANPKDAQDLADFFSRQPSEAFEYFKPHGFDLRSIQKLVKDPAFIMILAVKGSTILGYAFLRCFANGKSFRGKIVGIGHRGHGIAKQFGVITTRMASNLGVRLYGTVSKSNLPSMASSKSSNEIRVIEELPDGYLLIQYLPKH